MTFIQKHKLAWRKFRSAAGYPVIVDYLCTDRDKIIGFVCFSGPNFKYDMPMEWDINGKPLKLPINQGLDLVPLRGVSSYEVIPIEERI